MDSEIQKRKVSVVGLGYVGLPLVIEFAQHREVVAFDINSKRIEELKSGVDRTGEVEPQALQNNNIKFTDDKNDLKEADFHIVAVPTPVDQTNIPDLKFLIDVSQLLGEVIKTGDIIVYESTVYPGVTEEECLPVLEKTSGLKAHKDFKVGYSPERINPGDKEHTFKTVQKIVSGEDEATLEVVASIYSEIIKAGVYKAPSIRVAEAAKVVENIQRDLNISLMNELAMLFHTIHLDTNEVLKAAGTKWNFLPFKPGLVGGHCIDVDPYYMTYLAKKNNFYPQVINSGRSVNERVANFIADKTIQHIMLTDFCAKDYPVTILGLTFKENCKDTRNSKVINLIKRLKEFGVSAQVCDPWADAKEVKSRYGLELKNMDELTQTHSVICAVAHKEFQSLTPSEINKLLMPGGVLVDVKGIFHKETIEELGLHYWSL